MNDFFDFPIQKNASGNDAHKHYIRKTKQKVQLKAQQLVAVALFYIFFYHDMHSSFKISYFEGALVETRKKLLIPKLLPFHMWSYFLVRQVVFLSTQPD